METYIFQIYISQEYLELGCRLQEKLHRVTGPL